MAWAKFDDGYPRNRKVRRLSDAAYRLDTSAIMWSAEQLTDGHIPFVDLGDVSSVRHPERAADELVRAGRWHPANSHDCDRCPSAADGWVIHGYLEYNPAKAEVLARREADAERKRRGRGGGGRPPRSPNGVRADSTSDSGVESTQDSPRNPRGLRAESSTCAPAGAHAGHTRPVPSPNYGTTSTGAYVASADAREPAAEPPPGQPTTAETLTAAYAAGVPLADHDRALRAIVRALGTYDPAMVRRGVDQLVAEQRTCTPDTLRIAILEADGNWRPARADRAPTAPRPSTTDQRVAAALDLANRLADDPAPPPLRALPGGAA